MTRGVVSRAGDAGVGGGLGWVELPPVMPRFVRVPPRPGGTGVRVLPVEQVVEAHLPELFTSDRIEARAVFRVTRQAGIATTPEVDDMLTSGERQLRLGRHGTAV